MSNAILRRASLLLLAVLGPACRGRIEPNLVQLTEARRLVAQMRVDLAKASDASNRAVLADTDEDSVHFAQQARISTDAVATALPLLAARTSGPDAAGVAHFREQLDRYRQVDSEILALAVENTNLKAQRLSFGPVREAADRFVSALDTAAAAAPRVQQWQAQALAAHAALGVREIQVLQAPHIAAPTDAEMDRLEAQMAAHRAAVEAALERLSAGGPAVRAHVEVARAALGRFNRLSAQLIALSRRNTNVRSLQLALRQKPAVTAACDETLAALVDALARKGSAGRADSAGGEVPPQQQEQHDLGGDRAESHGGRMAKEPGAPPRERHWLQTVGEPGYPILSGWSRSRRMAAALANRSAGSRRRARARSLRLAARRAVQRARRRRVPEQTCAGNDERVVAGNGARPVSSS